MNWENTKILNIEQLLSKLDNVGRISYNTKNTYIELGIAFNLISIHFVRRGVYFSKHAVYTYKYI